ncbi:MAG TPA: LLM class flavin-dependent oxidoreductase [Burkholderiales bacterium]|nr:LLM class flavin-dependent oxidoreductase [Burkholderiales bacterium]
MKLSILDQSPIISGHTPAQAVAETIKLAQAAEEFGYYRYWLAEHHALQALADPCPEILVTRVAAATSRIRVGTGGILLPYYSPLKIAEQFRMLEALFPQRIDLGLGRAPGGDQTTAMAMGEGRYPTAEDFPEHVQYLVAYLDDAMPKGHPFAKVKAQPMGPTAPEVWLLGSSDYSGALAAQLGLRFAFAHFISADGGDQVMRDYKRKFQPSPREEKATALLTVFVICAETDAEAERRSMSVDLRRLNMDYGINTPVPNQQEAETRKYTDVERQRIAFHRRRVILGKPDTVKARLLALAEQFEADELMVITITGDYRTRLESYRLLAGEFGLCQPA